MRFASIFAAASLVASVFAQGRIAFTQTPSSVRVGSSTTISWAGGDGSPVTITLKKGDPNRLETVAVLIGDATGNSFTWTPSSSLVNGDDYALSISQGLNPPNYSGEFSVSGGKAAGSSTSASASASASATSLDSTTILAVGHSTTSALTTLSPSANATTLTLPSASGTGVSVSRNTTFSSATIKTTKHATVTSTAGATTTGGASGTTGATGTTASASATNTGAAVANTVSGALSAGAAAFAVLFWL